jgi:chemotaxis protein MotB
VIRPPPSAQKPVGHADDWLMTYADTITLLLCFFVIFVVGSAAEKALPPKVQTLATREVTAPPAPSPPRPAPVPVPRSIVWGPLSDDPLPAPPRPIASTAAKPAEVKDVAAAPALPRTADDSARTPLAVIPPPALADSAKPASAPAEPAKGDPIAKLDIGSAAFFDSGSAALTPAGKSILHGMLPRLQAAVAEGYGIRVEGHTDDEPIDTSMFPSNWELSTARAAAVVHFLLDEGIAPQRLRAVGYADTEPKAPDRDTAGNPLPQNQALNRRVVIRLEKIDPAAP